MIYSKELENMCRVAKGVDHGPAPIPEEGKWVKAKEIKDISGLTHGIGWCAPQQGACKLTLNVKDGIIQEALIETVGCSGMTHSAAMAGEILTGKTILEATLEAARLRFRPIVMTSLAFTIGVLPLAISSGAGAGSRHAIGTGVIGGMIASTTIAIFFAPLFYNWLARLNAKFTKKGKTNEA